MPRACVTWLLPEVIQFAVDLLVFDVAAAVLVQRRSAHGALQTTQMPVQVIHLRTGTQRAPLTTGNSGLGLLLWHENGVQWRPVASDSCLTSDRWAGFTSSSGGRCDSSPWAGTGRGSPCRSWRTGFWPLGSRGRRPLTGWILRTPSLSPT